MASLPRCPSRSRRRRTATATPEGIARRRGHRRRHRDRVRGRRRAGKSAMIEDDVRTAPRPSDAARDRAWASSDRDRVAPDAADVAARTARDVTREREVAPRAVGRCRRRVPRRRRAREVGQPRRARSPACARSCARYPAPRLRGQRAVLARRGVLRAEGLPARPRRSSATSSRPTRVETRSPTRYSKWDTATGARPDREGARRAGASRESLSRRPSPRRSPRSDWRRREAIDAALASRCFVVPARRDRAAVVRPADGADERSIPARPARRPAATAAARQPRGAATRCRLRQPNVIVVGPDGKVTRAAGASRPRTATTSPAAARSHASPTTRSTRGPVPDLHVVRSRRHAVGHLLLLLQRSVAVAEDLVVQPADHEPALDLSR